MPFVTPRPAENYTELQPDSLSILNSGTDGGLDDESIFKRFYKAHNTGDGMGLGLAIVKEICALVNFNIYYQFDQGMHKFVIQFQDKVSLPNRLSLLIVVISIFICHSLEGQEKT
jgi:hypothetical protein